MLNIKLKSFFTFVMFVTIPSTAFSNWFGPDNYEECILEEMKEQDKSMLSIAELACEKSFPYEKELHDYQTKLDTTWDSNRGKLTLNIVENSGDYEVTRYKAHFSTSDCKSLAYSSSYSEFYKLSRSIKQNDNHPDWEIKQYYDKTYRKADSDFNYTVMFDFTENAESATVLIKRGVQYKCYRTDTVWGKRRK